MEAEPDSGIFAAPWEHWTAGNPRPASPEAVEAVVVGQTAGLEVDRWRQLDADAPRKTAERWDPFGLPFAELVGQAHALELELVVVVAVAETPTGFANQKSLQQPRQPEHLRVAAAEAAFDFLLLLYPDRGLDFARPTLLVLSRSRPKAGAEEANFAFCHRFSRHHSSLGTRLAGANFWDRVARCVSPTGSALFPAKIDAGVGHCHGGLHRRSCYSCPTAWAFAILEADLRLEDPSVLRRQLAWNLVGSRL